MRLNERHRERDVSVKACFYSPSQWPRLRCPGPKPDQPIGDMPEPGVPNRTLQPSKRPLVPPNGLPCSHSINRSLRGFAGTPSSWPSAETCLPFGNRTVGHDGAEEPRF